MHCAGRLGSVVSMISVPAPAPPSNVSDVNVSDVVVTPSEREWTEQAAVNVHGGPCALVTHVWAPPSERPRATPASSNVTTRSGMSGHNSRGSESTKEAVYVPAPSLHVSGLASRAAVRSESADRRPPQAPRKSVTDNPTARTITPPVSALLPKM